MSLWLISRPNDEVDYDEYDAMVVRAASPDEARELAAEQGKRWNAFPTENAIAVEVTADGEPGVILASFNAG